MPVAPVWEQEHILFHSYGTILVFGYLLTSDRIFHSYGTILVFGYLLTRVYGFFEHQLSCLTSKEKFCQEQDKIRKPS
jgi:hypothetical protein